jgi:zinc transport system substrate-binding protein
MHGLKIIKLLLLFIAVILLGDIRAADSPKTKMKTFVSILPQAYVVERIGGPYVEVHIMVGEGQSPATYDPSPKQIAMLNESKLYFRIGTPFEKGLIRKIQSSAKHLEVVDTRKNVKLRYFERSTGPQIPDPHIWLDPKRVKIQADTICDALCRMDPTHANEFRNTLRAFKGDLTRLDAKISRELSPLKGKKFYVFHPAFGYFADSYGLRQVAVEIEGKEPTARQMTALIEMAKKDNAKVVFVQPQYTKKNTETLAKAINGKVVTLNPLPRDYIEGLETMAHAIWNALTAP